MLEKLFKLITLSTILSLIFITVSCKYVDKFTHHSDEQKTDNNNNDNNNQQASEKILLDGVVILDSIYSNTEEPGIWYRFSKYINTIEITDNNKYRTISNTMKITNVTHIETSDQYIVQAKLDSITCILENAEVVKAANNGKLEDEDGAKYDLDIPENIRGWKLNEEKNITGMVADIDKSITYQLKVSEDKKTITLRHILYDGTLSDPEKYNLIK